MTQGPGAHRREPRQVGGQIPALEHRGQILVEHSGRGKEKAMVGPVGAIEQLRESRENNLGSGRALVRPSAG